MQVEQQEQFNIRLSKWIASQGFWFQLRHSVAGSGTRGTIMYHLLRLSFRVLIFVALLAVGGVYYLFKRTDQPAFRAELRQSISESIGASQLAMRGARRSEGNLEISRLASEGGPDTFFEYIEIRNLRCRMGLLDGLVGVWEPGPVSIHRLDIQLRAGTDSPEYSAKIGEIVFREFENVDIRNITIASANIGWGYSERTRGRIDDTNVRLERVGDDWRITLRGGRFSQNWLRDIDVDEMVVLCTPEGVVFEKTEMRQGEGTLDFAGLTVSAGDRPEVRGVVKARDLSLEPVLPLSARSYVEGSFSSDFTVTGSTNTIDGVSFDGVLTMSPSNTITVRDRIHLFRALSVVDFHNNYRRLDFSVGSLRLTTHSGRMMLRDINLRHTESNADDLVTISGQILARPPTSSEIDLMLARGDQARVSDGLGFQDDEDENFLLDVSELERQFTLRQAANAARRAQEGAVEDEGQLFDRIGMNYEARLFAERQTSRLARMLIYEGELAMTVRPNAFDRTETLQERFPVNEETGRIHFSVPLGGPLHELTYSEADAIYEMGRR